MKSSCIPTVPDDPFYIVRRWAIEACESDRCGAALLAILEFRHNGIRDDNELFGQIDMAFPHSMGEWIDELFGQYTRHDIKRSLQHLENLGFVTISDHPDKSMRGKPGERKKWYRFHPEIVTNWLLTHGKIKKSPIDAQSPNLENGEIRRLHIVSSDKTPVNSHFPNLDFGENQGSRDSKKRETPVKHHCPNLENGEINHFPNLAFPYKEERNMNKKNKNIHKENLTPDTESVSDGEALGVFNSDDSKNSDDPNTQPPPIYTCPSCQDPHSAFPCGYLTRFYRAIEPITGKPVRKPHRNPCRAVHEYTLSDLVRATEFCVAKHAKDKTSNFLWPSSFCEPSYLERLIHDSISWVSEGKPSLTGDVPSWKAEEQQREVRASENWKNLVRVGIREGEYHPDLEEHLDRIASLDSKARISEMHRFKLAN